MKSKSTLLLLIPTIISAITIFADNNAKPEPSPTEIIHTCMKQRIMKDIDTVQKFANQLPNKDKQKRYIKQLDLLRKEVESLPSQYGPDFKTIFPINSIHEKVFNILGKIWEEEGLKQTIIWSIDPYLYMEHLPQKPTPTKIDDALFLEMMINETRSVAFNIASPKNTEVVITISGLPNEYIEVRKVVWTDTKKLEPVASALLPIQEETGVYKVPITGGLIQQTWLTIHSKNLNPNTYNLTVKVNDKTLPFTLIVYPIYFPDRPSLHMGGWDYTNVPKHYEVTEANRSALVKMLQEYFVDSPWATSVAMPFGTYDEHGNMTAPPDTSNFDEWRKLWNNARRYCVFVNVPQKLKNWELGSPEFNKAVGEWAKFWDNYMRQAGLDPSQLVILLVDEPREPSMDKIIIAWAKAIK